MEAVYIQFQAPRSTTKHSMKNWAAGVLSKIFPTANPDFESKMEEVEYWLVECDRASGVPQREIGLNHASRVIMKMPFKDNYGYWTDNNLLLDDFKKQFNASAITKEAFERQWTLFDNMSSFQTQLGSFKILSTGADGGHSYVEADLDYKGTKQKLTIFFADKMDEQKIMSRQVIRVSGTLLDEGLQQSLILLDGKLIDE